MGNGHTSATLAPPLSLGLRLNLSVLMFLQFAIWGSWAVFLSIYLTDLRFDKVVIGSIFATMALGSMVSPIFVGQIADRYFSSERLMGILHLAGGGMLYWMAQTTDPQLFYWVALGYALVYSPTLALANSIAFTHVPSGERDFPSIRVLGTLGWIVAGIAVDLMGEGAKHSNEPLLLAAGLSAALGLYSFMLPHTPPTGKPGDAVPFLKAVSLLKEFSFSVFYGVSFVITIVLAFYYTWTGPYLDQHLKVEKIGSTMGIGQWAELVLLPFLPFFLSRFGMKWVLAIGMLAWGVRYGIFALGEPYWLVIASLALHGVCFDFFFAAGFIHVDNKSPATIRASAQALFAFLTYGAGMWLGGELSGYVAKHNTDAAGVTNWSSFWTFPSIGVFVSLAIFVLFFRDRPTTVQLTPATAD
jgi:nucleoside transporter